MSRPALDAGAERLEQVLFERERRKDQLRRVYDSIVIVSGSRSFNRYELFAEIIDDWLAKHERELGSLWCFLSGDAKDGADAMIPVYANPEPGKYMERHVCEFLPALWDEFGQGAGFIRNHEMGDLATHVVGVWDTKSRGTQDMLEYGRKKGLHVSTYLVDADPQMRRDEPWRQIAKELRQKRTR